MRHMRHLKRLLLLATLISGQAMAGHDWGGMDLCAVYPEKMPPGMPVEQLPQASHPGALLMQSYCAQCHNLPGPGHHTAAEWPPVLEKMNTLMEVSSRFGGLLGRVKEPSQSERLQIQEYLLGNALQPMAASAGGLGGNSYQYNCSGCHALPDPTQHRRDEWPAIMARMARNREVMKRPPLSPETQLTILATLQSESSQQTVTTADSEEVAPPPQTAVTSTTLALWRAESWLALGPFLFLVVVGLIRWGYALRRPRKIIDRKIINPMGLG
jgi:cytochrome c5